MNALPVLMLTQDATLWQEWQQIAGPSVDACARPDSGRFATLEAARPYRGGAGCSPAILARADGFTLE